MTLKKLPAPFIAATMLPFSTIAEDHPIRLVIHGGAGTILGSGPKTNLFLRGILNRRRLNHDVNVAPFGIIPHSRTKKPDLCIVSNMFFLHYH